MTRNTESLPQLATKIHALEKKTIASTIEIGRLLQVAFDRFEHGDRTEYHAWVENEFAWSERTARRYRELYEFQIGHHVQFEKLNITLTALYYLAELSKTDDPELVSMQLLPAIEEVIRAGKKKKRITRERAAEIISDHHAIRLAEALAEEAEEAKRQAELDAADEPDADAGEPADVEPEPDADADADADDADDADADEPPPANELTKALQVILANGIIEDAAEWWTATRIISSLELNIIIDRLKHVSAQYGSGSDALRRAEARSAHAKYIAKETARRAALNAPLLAPITVEKEKAYTNLIKSCALYEGACDLSWPEYFAYREAHPECETLTKGNLAYAGQWTSCAVRATP